MQFLRKNPLKKINKLTTFLKNVKSDQALQLVESYCDKQKSKTKLLLTSSDTSKLILYSLMMNPTNYHKNDNKCNNWYKFRKSFYISDNTSQLHAYVMQSVKNQ